MIAAAAIASRCGLIIAYPRSRGWATLLSRPAAACRNARSLASSPSFRPIGCGLPRSAGLASRFLPPTPLTGAGTRDWNRALPQRPWDLPGKAAIGERRTRRCRQDRSVPPAGKQARAGARAPQARRVHQNQAVALLASSRCSLSDKLNSLVPCACAQAVSADAFASNGRVISARRPS